MSFRGFLLLSTGDAAESLGVNLWGKWSLFYLLWEEVSDLYTPAADIYLLFCHLLYATTTSVCYSICISAGINGRKM